MGNSHAYTSLDAAVLSQAAGLDVELLGSPSQYMEQTLENLKVVLNYQSPKYIILEINALYGDNKEKMQGESRGFQLQNSDGIENYCYKFQSVVNTYKPVDVLTAMFQLVRPVNMWTRWEKFSERKDYIKDANGFRGTGSFAVLSIEMQEFQDAYQSKYFEGKKTELTDYNEAAFRDFLNLAQKNNIEVWIYKAPTTRTAYAGYTCAVEEICRDYENVAYIDDMHMVAADIGLTGGDWYDSGHLSRSGAGKVTQYYGQLMAERFGRTADFASAFAYQTETVAENPDGTYSYAMKNYSKDCLYQFKMYVDGILQDVQEYSEKNVYECEYDIRINQNCQIYCSMIPGRDADLGDNSASRIYLSFMKQNECVIE
ncbi:MAG: hypothetical protein J6C37_01135 [Roseburia sp.]|nr:hypothetical protein [Roseburia sp.]